MPGAGRPTRYAIVGAGGRSSSYLRGLLAEPAGTAVLAGVIDPNRGRAERLRAMADGTTSSAAVLAGPDGLESVIAAQEIDRVIVCSPDWTHADLVARTLRAGADAVVEKPLTIDDEGCRTVAAAIAETGRDVVAAFNYRYAPRSGAVRSLLAAGEIGTVTSIHFEWMLDTSHGADYFRRWHRDKTKSGGLLVHKASHHFDLVNWWLGDVPARVFASGGLRFYGAENARRRGLGERSARGSVGTPSDDPFVLDMRRHPELRELYLDHEHEDGYLRDQDVFTDGITIEDSLSLVVDYARGATMTYALTAFSPWEGYRIAFTGTAGRLELEVVERASVIRTPEGIRVVDPSLADDELALAGARPPGQRLVLQPLWEPAREIALEHGSGPHGGGDARLLRDIFRGPDPGDDLHRAATFEDGIRAVAVGIAGNRSLSTGQPVSMTGLDLGVAL